MPLALGKVVKSNTHTDYVCQVYGKKEVPEVPQADNYKFGTFVGIDLEDNAGQLIGLVYDTVLLNPEFGKLGPRLSPEQELDIFTPDYLNERAVLLGITAIGRADSQGSVEQGVPLLAANNDAQVYQLTGEQIRYFHLNDEDEQRLSLRYMPLLIQQQNPLTPHLVRAVLKQLTTLLPDYRQMLDVLADDLAWRTQVTPMGGM